MWQYLIFKLIYSQKIQARLHFLLLIGIKWITPIIYDTNKVLPKSFSNMISHTDINDIPTMARNMFHWLILSFEFFLMWWYSFEDNTWEKQVFTLSPSTNVWPSLALLQEMSGRGSPSATQEIMAALPSMAVTFFSWVIWGGTGGHRRWDRRGEEKKVNKDIYIYGAVGNE